MYRAALARSGLEIGSLPQCNAQSRLCGAVARYAQSDLTLIEALDPTLGRTGT
jgi:hypothetical protein